MGCDHSWYVPYRLLWVSIHAPAWGATGPSLQQSAILQSFNPRTRVGCDHRGWLRCGHLRWFQSTHPRGVRLDHGATVHYVLLVSIHAPAWGATLRGPGADGRTVVSIHAPAWGATYSGATTMVREGKCFNPRTRVGCDTCSMGDLLAHGVFQSTHPRGVRPTAGRLTGGPVMFQSTHPRGVRHAAPRVSLLSMMFQSTHPRGVRHRHR